MRFLTLTLSKTFFSNVPGPQLHNIFIWLRLHFHKSTFTTILFGPHPRASPLLPFLLRHSSLINQGFICKRVCIFVCMRACVCVCVWGSVSSVKKKIKHKFHFIYFKCGRQMNQTKSEVTFLLLFLLHSIYHQVNPFVSWPSLCVNDCMASVVWSVTIAVPNVVGVVAPYNKVQLKTKQL